MALCLIALGSNLGDREATLSEAVRRLEATPGIDVRKQSRWYATVPVGGPAGQGQFLNGALLVETSKSPEDLLAVLRQVEMEAGRRRDDRWGPRTLDLDLLLYGDVVIDHPDLTLPHPRMAWRRFVLQPAAEIAPTMVHPTTGWTIGGLLDHLDHSPLYLAVAGLAGRATAQLAKQIAAVLNARLLFDEVTPRWLDDAATDSSGDIEELPLEFLNHIGPKLFDDAWDWFERPAVSDFWFGQAEAYAETLLADNRLLAFRQREAALPDIVRPRLTVVWDAHWPHAEREEYASALRQAIVRRASQPGHGPVLWLGDVDEATALVEVMAAVESMK